MPPERKTTQEAPMYVNDPRKIAADYLKGRDRFHPGGQKGYWSLEDTVNKWTTMADPELAAEIIVEDNLDLTDDQCRLILGSSALLRSASIKIVLDYFETMGDWPKHPYHLPPIPRKLSGMSDEDHQLKLKQELIELGRLREDLYKDK